MIVIKLREFDFVLDHVRLLYIKKNELSYLINKNDLDAYIYRASRIVN